MQLYSNELKKDTQVNVILPNYPGYTEAPYKTLWLLHGRSQDHTAWLRNSDIEEYAARYRLAVIMPNADRSWYTDTAYGMNYFSYITNELREVCYRNFKTLSDRREDNIVAGVSMGGYGAVKMALSKPELFGACISLSGALDIVGKSATDNANEWRSIFGLDGELQSMLKGSEHDLFSLVGKLKSSGKSFPRIYTWCGLDDRLLSSNEAFHNHLDELLIDHRFDVSEGDHSWKWWNLHLKNALEWTLYNG
jgi:putative tributyrin esterase